MPLSHRHEPGNLPLFAIGILTHPTHPDTGRITVYMPEMYLAELHYFPLLQLFLNVNFMAVYWGDYDDMGADGRSILVFFC